MKFSVLSSGSKANCTYFEAADTRLLIDCGLSGLQTERRLRALGIDPLSIDAILVTHEHSDHIHGIPTMSRKFRLPVFANSGASEYLNSLYAQESFCTGNSFTIKGLTISPFSIPHDASDPVGFTILAEGLKFTQSTDLGKITPLVRDALTNCNAIVLESNHDPQMLQECGYPWDLKQRIASNHGHLSNGEAGEVLGEVLHPELSHVVLAHLSENSNNPDLAYRTVSSRIEHHPSNQLKHLVCACVARATPLFELGGSSGAESPLEIVEDIRAVG